VGRVRPAAHCPMDGPCCPVTDLASAREQRRGWVWEPVIPGFRAVARLGAMAARGADPRILGASLCAYRILPYVIGECKSSFAGAQEFKDLFTLILAGLEDAENREIVTH